MKFIQTLKSGADNKVYAFHLGKDEAELVLGLLIKAWQQFPVGEKWKPDGVRMKNMIKGLKQGLSL